MARNRERGGSSVKTLFVLLILGGLVFAGVKVVPAYVNNYQLQDSMNTAARFAMANRQSPDDLRNEIYKKTQDLGINVKKEDIKVTMGDVASGLVQVSLSYSVPVNLQVYEFELQFTPHADNRSI
jgi:Flp pilus assembly protein TadG